MFIKFKFTQSSNQILFFINKAIWFTLFNNISLQRTNFKLYYFKRRQYCDALSSSTFALEIPAPAVNELLAPSGLHGPVKDNNFIFTM